MSLPRCKKCGQCCRNMGLIHPPSYFEKWYKEWLDNETPGKDVHAIYLIYPMLIPLGYDRRVKKYRYRCKHLTAGNRCSIYPYRPKYPCKEYGTGDPDRIRMDQFAYQKRNTKLYPKCVF